MALVVLAEVARVEVVLLQVSPPVPMVLGAAARAVKPMAIAFFAAAMGHIFVLQRLGAAQAGVHGAAYLTPQLPETPETLVLQAAQQRVP